MLYCKKMCLFISIGTDKNGTAKIIHLRHRKSNQQAKQLIFLVRLNVDVEEISGRDTLCVSEVAGPISQLFLLAELEILIISSSSSEPVLSSSS